MKLPDHRPGRPRRRTSDSLDVGYRVSVALFADWLWSLLLALILTSEVRGPEWVVLSLVGLLPLVGVNVYGFWTLRAFIDDRSWARAQRMTNPEDPEK